LVPAKNRARVFDCRRIAIDAEERRTVALSFEQHRASAAGGIENAERLGRISLADASGWYSILANASGYDERDELADDFRRRVIDAPTAALVARQRRLVGGRCEWGL
jgi:hypothetical protein